MKIVIDARESGTSTGRYVDKLIEYLHALKPEHDIIALTKSHRLKYLGEIAPSFQIIESNFKEFTFAEQRGLLKQINGLRPDLVHFGVVQQPVAYRGKTVTTIHDLTTLRFDNPAKNRLVFKTKQRVYARVIKRAARKSTFIFTPSKFVKDDVAQFTGVNPSKIVITYEAANRITVPAELIKNLVDKQFIMYVGRPQPHKNLDRLVEAFAEVKSKHPQLQLVLAGKKDILYERLEKRIQKRGVEGVTFTGFVDDAQLRWLYENTAAYVFPSLSEGFGLPALEAMAQGAPVLSSNATCLPEIYGSAASYFDPLNTADMATKITDVLEDSKLRAKLVNAGRDQAAKYSWKTMAQQTLDIYNKAL